MKNIIKNIIWKLIILGLTVIVAYCIYYMTFIEPISLLFGLGLSLVCILSGEIIDMINEKYS